MNEINAAVCQNTFYDLAYEYKYQNAKQLLYKTTIKKNCGFLIYLTYLKKQQRVLKNMFYLHAKNFEWNLCSCMFQSLWLKNYHELKTYKQYKLTRLKPICTCIHSPILTKASLQGTVYYNYTCMKNYFPCNIQ